MKTIIFASLRERLAQLLILALALWAVGAPFGLGLANAGNLEQVRDTVSDSDLGVTSNHTLSFGGGSALDADDTIVITFRNNSGNNFALGALVAGDVTETSGVNVVASCTGGAGEALMATSTSGSDRIITLTICATDTLAVDTTNTLTFGNDRITNPAVAGSYLIEIEYRDEGSSAAVLDEAQTRVAIIDDVVVTAAVDASFTFTVAGLNAGISINGATTTATSTATTVPFGTLTVGTPSTVGQELTVSTNAANGFAVTVEADNELTSANNANINFFANAADDANGNSSVTAWSSPTPNISQDNTWGHFGVTSDDDGYGGTGYVGDFNQSARTVFSHNGPADGTTADIGLARVAYRVEVSALQEAANDYTNTLTYVATPTF